MKNQTIVVGLRVNKSVHDRMKELAKKERWSLGRVALVAVERYLDLRKVKKVVASEDNQ